MAYPTKGREPLFDSETQAALEKRSKELLGIALAVAGIMIAMMVGSYSPDDPNWLVATDAPVHNWLGRFGASMAHPLHMIGGRMIWGAALLFVVWGGRLALHRGAERLTSRLVFGPIWLVVVSVYLATVARPEGWGLSYGTGGHLGDTVLAMVLSVLPIGEFAAIKLMAAISGASMIVLGGYVLGFTGVEMRAAFRAFLIGLIQAYEMLLALLGRTAEHSARVAQGVSAHVKERVQDKVQDHLAARRAQSAADSRAWEEAQPDQNHALQDRRRAEAQRVAAVVRSNPVFPTDSGLRRMPGEVPQRIARADPEAHDALRPEPPMHRMPSVAPLGAPGSFAAPVRAAEPQPRGLLARGAQLLRRADPVPARMPELELPTDIAYAGEVPDGIDDERIRSRISDVIRSRAEAAAPRVEPQVTRAKGPRPLLLETGRAVGAAAMQAAVKATVQATGQAAGAAMTARDTAPRVYVPDARGAIVAGDGTDLEFADDDGFADDADVIEPAVPLRSYTAAPAATDPRRSVVQHQPKKAALPSARAKAEAQPALPLEDKYADYEFPPLSLLTSPTAVERHHLSDSALEENARMLESVLDDYGVKGEIVSVRPGPVVTMYELEPAPGLKASRVIGLADDIARSMSALSARVSTVPGRSVIGIELPNERREKVVLREILAARDFGDSQMRLPLALGKDIGGEPIIANLAKMPHLLIAGTTGSGKSVAINTMILSLLYKLTPQECRLIMIDPKMLELSVYDGIPHLLSPVVTDPKKAVVALKWTVGEMEERYRKMSKMGVRNIEGYNGRVRDALEKGETFDRTIQTGFDEETGDPIFESETMQPELLPYIVVIVDEMADLMMVAGKEIEACIQRLAQMARASGIHLIMATQRPSVDVITGTIKANFPTRISFQVTSKIDSRTILNEMGAEQLLGMGDMLYMAGGSKITRIHGPFCSDEEVEEIVNHLKGFGPPEYLSGVVEGPDEGSESAIDAVLGLAPSAEGDDALYDMAVQIAAKDRKCSTSYIQRKLAIGYNKAARLVEQMEDNGVVTAANHVGKREVLVPEPHYN